MPHSDTKISPLISYIRVLTFVRNISLILGGLSLLFLALIPLLRASGALPPGSGSSGLQLEAPGVSIRLVSPLPWYTGELLALAGMFWFLLFLYILQGVLRLAHGLKDGESPFSIRGLQFIQRVAIGFFVVAFLQVVMEVLVVFSLQDWARSVEQMHGLHVQTGISIPLIPITAGFLTLVFRYIFQYGLTLQNENDSIV